MRVSIKAIAEDAEVVDGVKVKSAGAWAAPDGSFELSTYLQGDGVRAGKYAITFKVGQDLSDDWRLGSRPILKGKYSDPDTSDVFTVTVTGSETEPIDLGTIDLPTPTDTPTP